MKIENLKLKIRQRGFTLVELLVVIGVLGILAAGLLATIDPLEQFRKGADTNNKTAALELTNALTRYYATKGVMPWPAEVNCTVPTTPPTRADAAAFSGCLAALENQGELKKTFKEATNMLKSLYVTDKTVGTAVSVAVCYVPTSKSEQSRTTETKYDQAGDTCAATPGVGSGCYWCAR